MLVYVLGAPGAGKTALAPHLGDELREWVVLDWDFQLEGASALAGRDVRRDQDLWIRYDELVLATVRLVTRRGANCVVLGVRTPAELVGWEIDAWLLLDCRDDVRRERLASADRSEEVDDALVDAAALRALGLVTIDATSSTPAQAAGDLASRIGMLEARYREL